MSDILGWACVAVAVVEWALIIVMLPGYLRDRRRAAGLRPPPLPGERITPEMMTEVVMKCTCGAERRGGAHVSACLGARRPGDRVRVWPTWSDDL